MASRQTRNKETEQPRERRANAALAAIGIIVCFQLNYGCPVDCQVDPAAFCAQSSKRPGRPDAGCLWCVGAISALHRSATLLQLEPRRRQATRNATRGSESTAGLEVRDPAPDDLAQIVR